MKDLTKCIPSEANILATLRSLVPQRPLRYQEAIRIAELQANRFRELLQINSPAFPHEAITELPKITVAFDEEIQVSGSAHWNGASWIIVINAHEDPIRQRFSLAHEFKHILDHTTRHFMYRDDAKYTAREQAERVADFFAGCLLMPKSQLKRLYYQGTQKPFELSKQFQTSVRAIHCRLRQTGIAEKEPDVGNWHTNVGNLRYNQREMSGVGL
jgi:hypothetical protein